LKYLDVEAVLYETDAAGFALVVGESSHPFSELAADFNANMRPLGFRISLELGIPAGSRLVHDVVSWKDELWLTHEPLPELELNRLLALVSSRLPDGWLSANAASGGWTFQSAFELSDGDKEGIRGAFAQLRLPGSLELSTGAAIPATRTTSGGPAQFDLITSREIPPGLGTIRRLVERDEEHWRDFLARRDERRVEPLRPSDPNVLGCLFDAADDSDVSLSELVTLYDRIDVVATPARMGDTLKRLGISVAELQELVALKRLRLVLPQSALHYVSRPIEAAFEAHPDSVILSRALGARVVEHGQHKDPLLYGPFAITQRIELLKALLAASGELPVREVLAAYADLIGRQHSFFTGRGAQGSMTSGVGPLLANIMQRRTGRDHMLELMFAGSQVEWSIALGDTYVPPSYGGFSIGGHAAAAASFYGRVGKLPADPIGNRMHTVVDGLLALADVPPLEVAKNLQGGSLARFRSVAKRLLRENVEPAELAAAVAEINSDVEAYDGRLQSLRRWGVNSFTADAVQHATAAYLHHEAGFFGSLMSSWIAERIATKLPEAFKEEIALMGDTLRGLVLAPSNDAVIVRRVQQQVHDTGRH
jgi:hypothetical protein